MGLCRDYRNRPPRAEPALWTIDCHHLGSGPPFYTSSLWTWVPRAAPSCPGLKAPAGIPGTGRGGGRRALLLHPLAPGKYREVQSMGFLVGKPRAPVVQDRQDEHCSAAASSLKTC